MASQGQANREFAGVIDWREAQVDEFEREMVRVAKRMEREIRDQVSRFTTSDGSFVGDEFTLGRADALRGQLDDILGASGYQESVGRFMSTVPELQSRVNTAWLNSGFEPDFTQVDKDAFKLITGGAFEDFANVGADGLGLIRTRLLDAVTGGESARGFGAQLRALLASQSDTLRDRAGHGMFRHAGTLAETSLAQLHRFMDRRAADGLGIERWLYLGGIIETSRPFCIDLSERARAGETWSMEQIEKMDNGMMPKGTVFETAGGWRCRHQWVPQVETAKEQQERERRTPVVAVAEKTQEGARMVERAVVALEGGIVAADRGINLALDLARAAESLELLGGGPTLLSDRLKRLSGVQQWLTGNLVPILHDIRLGASTIEGASGVIASKGLSRKLARASKTFLSGRNLRDSLRTPAVLDPPHVRMAGEPALHSAAAEAASVVATFAPEIPFILDLEDAVQIRVRDALRAWREDPSAENALDLEKLSVKIRRTFGLAETEVLSLGTDDVNRITVTRLGNPDRPDIPVAVDVSPRAAAALPTQVVDFLRTQGVAPGGIRIATTVDERRELFDRFGPPNSIDIGEGIFGGRTGRLYVDVDGRPVGYAPPGDFEVPESLIPDSSTLAALVRDNPEGFTVNLRGKAAEGGFAVAPSKATEKIIKVADFDDASLEAYIYEHADMFEREGAHLGGWFDSATDTYVLDASFPLESYEDAVRVAIWGEQDAIFDLSTFTEIRTRDAAGKAIVPPGFPQTVEEVLAARPDNNGAFAEASWRRSQRVRQEVSAADQAVAAPEVVGRRATPELAPDQAIFPVISETTEDGLITLRSVDRDTGIDLGRIEYRFVGDDSLISLVDIEDTARRETIGLHLIDDIEGGNVTGRIVFPEEAADLRDAYQARLFDADPVGVKTQRLIVGEFRPSGDSFVSPGAIYKLDEAGRLSDVESVVPGGGRMAVIDAIERGARTVDVPEGQLAEYYREFGFVNGEFKGGDRGTVRSRYREGQPLAARAGRQAAEGAEEVAESLAQAQRGAVGEGQFGIPRSGVADDVAEGFDVEVVLGPEVQGLGNFYSRELSVRYLRNNSFVDKSVGKLNYRRGTSGFDPSLSTAREGLPLNIITNIRELDVSAPLYERAVQLLARTHGPGLRFDPLLHPRRRMIERIPGIQKSERGDFMLRAQPVELLRPSRTQAPRLVEAVSDVAEDASDQARLRAEVEFQVVNLQNNLDDFEAVLLSQVTDEETLVRVLTEIEKTPSSIRSSISASAREVMLFQEADRLASLTGVPEVSRTVTFRASSRNVIRALEERAVGRAVRDRATRALNEFEAQMVRGGTSELVLKAAKDAIDAVQNVGFAGEASERIQKLVQEATGIVNAAADGGFRIRLVESRGRVIAINRDLPDPKGFLTELTSEQLEEGERFLRALGETLDAGTPSPETVRQAMQFTPTARIQLSADPELAGILANARTLARVPPEGFDVRAQSIQRLRAASVAERLRELARHRSRGRQALADMHDRLAVFRTQLRSGPVVAEDIINLRIASDSVVTHANTIADLPPAIRLELAEQSAGDAELISSAQVIRRETGIDQRQSAVSMAADLAERRTTGSATTAIPKSAQTRAARQRYVTDQLEAFERSLELGDYRPALHQAEELMALPENVIVEAVIDDDRLLAIRAEVRELWASEHMVVEDGPRVVFERIRQRIPAVAQQTEVAANLHRLREMVEAQASPEKIRELLRKHQDFSAEAKLWATRQDDLAGSDGSAVRVAERLGEQGVTEAVIARERVRVNPTLVFTDYQEAIEDLKDALTGDVADANIKRLARDVQHQGNTITEAGSSITELTGYDEAVASSAGRIRAAEIRDQVAGTNTLEAAIKKERQAAGVKLRGVTLLDLEQFDTIIDELESAIHMSAAHYIDITNILDRLKRMPINIRREGLRGNRLTVEQSGRAQGILKTADRIAERADNVAVLRAREGSYTRKWSLVPAAELEEVLDIAIDDFIRAVSTNADVMTAENLLGDPAVLRLASFPRQRRPDIRGAGYQQLAIEAASDLAENVEDFRAHRVSVNGRNVSNIVEARQFEAVTLADVAGGPRGRILIQRTQTVEERRRGVVELFELLEDRAREDQLFVGEVYSERVASVAEAIVGLGAEAETVAGVPRYNKLLKEARILTTELDAGDRIGTDVGDALEEIGRLRAPDTDVADGLVATARQLGEDATQLIEQYGIAPDQVDDYIERLGSLKPDELFERITEGSGLEFDLDEFAYRDGTIWIEATPTSGESGRLTRKFNIREGYAEHKFFEIPLFERGSGKQVHANLVEWYDEVGITTVRLNANIDVGSYAWARYGYLPDNPQQVLGIVGRRWEGGVGDQVRRLDEDLFDRVEALLAEPPDDFVWQISDLQDQFNGALGIAGKVLRDELDGEVLLDSRRPMTLGQRLLMNASWDGYLDLTDSRQRGRFDAYVAGKKKGTAGSGAEVIARLDRKIDDAISELDDLESSLAHSVDRIDRDDVTAEVFEALEQSRDDSLLDIHGIRETIELQFRQNLDADEIAGNFAQAESIEQSVAVVRSKVEDLEEQIAQLTAE